MNEVLIREMKDEDWEEVQAIYKQGIDSGTATFMKNVPDFEYWDKAKLKIGRLVAEYNGKIVGWVTLSATSAREDYAGVNEVSIYVHENYKSLGIGKKLHSALEHCLKEMGILNMEACIGYPEEDDEYLTKNSAQFHEHLGYRMIGEFEKCGYKFHRWYNMIWMEKIIGIHEEIQTFPKKFDADMLKD